MAIVKAGITKFFQNGKNKILLDLTGAKGLPDEIVREIALLDLMARELAGRIVILTTDANIKSKIEHFATPPVVPVVATREQAWAAFTPKTEVDGKSTAQVQAQAETKAATAGPSSTVTTAEGKDLYKEQIKQREVTELGPLRKQVSDLENENKLIKEQLTTLLIARRNIADTKALQEKIQSLEQQLAELVAQAAPAAKK